jgi:hypothetical protein
MRFKKLIRYITGQYDSVQKIAFYVNEEYMFDHYENILACLDVDSFDLVLSDKFQSESYIGLINRLKSNSWNIHYLGDVIYKYKYRVFISHLYLGGNTTSAGTIFSRLINICYKGLGKLFPKMKGKGSQQYVQSSLGAYNIRMMYGADSGVNSFYEYGNNYCELFDVFFCHGPRDAEITKSVFSKPIFIMGYPRYDNYFELRDNSLNKDLLQEKYGLDRGKKTILWITTWAPHFSTIETYFKRMAMLVEHYNVIVRPHPLEIDPQYSRFNKSVFNLVTNGTFILSDNRYQDMTELYLVSDHVFCDYGASIFCALYMDKRIVLLNHKDVEKDLVASTSTSMEARDHLPSVNQDEDDLLDYLVMDWVLFDHNRQGARKYYFGDINVDASKRAAKYLTNCLDPKLCVES